MAKSRPTIMKRQRELARAEKRRDKASRRNVKGDPNSSERPEGADEDYDPDIAHIVPGPQPLPWADELEDEEEDEDKDKDKDKDVSED